MCFDCLLALPLFSSGVPDAGAKKVLTNLSRPNTPAPNAQDGYGSPLEHGIYQEDLPDPDKAGMKVPLDDGFGEGDSGTYEHGSELGSMDPTTGMEADAVLLVDMDQAEEQKAAPSDEKYVYEQDVEMETSLDDKLAVATGDDAQSEETNETSSTMETNGQKEIGRTDVVGHLEINLEYDESNGHLKVAIMQATNLTDKEDGGYKKYRVRLYLRPKKRQSSKTHFRPANAPVFKELFRFRQLPKDQLAISELLFKLHGLAKYGQEKLVGYAILNLSAMKAAAKQSFKVPLVQRTKSVQLTKSK